MEEASQHPETVRDGAADGRLDHAYVWVEAYAGWLVLFSSSLVGIAFAINHIWLSPNIKSWPYCVAAAVFLMFTIVLFTRPINKPSSMNAIFRFGWAFVAGLIVAGGILLYTTLREPPTAGEVASDSQQKNAKRSQSSAGTVAARDSSAAAAPASTEPVQSNEDVQREVSERNRVQWRLIRVVYGCDYHNPKSHTNQRKDDTTTQEDESRIKPENELPYNPAMPEGLFCGELPPQWVISIGGNILQCHFDGTCPKGVRKSINLGLSKSNLTAKKALVARLQASISDLPLKIKETTVKEQRKIAVKVKSGALAETLSTARREIGAAQDEIAALEADIAEEELWKNQGWNLEGTPIVGGIIVPVYFVVLALIGALVGMFRKMPEFQERVDSDYGETFAKRLADGDSPLPPITYGYARELVVFQMLQVVSAPAIAILAYSYARPEEVATTVLLAFGAGFSSEVVLLGVRGTVDRLIGLGPRPLRVRAMDHREAAVTKPKPLPAPGPVEPPKREKLGDFKIADRVTLVKPISIFVAGSQGIVMDIGVADTLVVRITQDHTGMPVDHLLEPRPPDFFRHVSDSETVPDGPAG